MQAIDKKLLRDFRRLWLQGLAIALVLACGVAILLTAIGMNTALSDTRDAYYDRNRFADVFAQLKRAPESLLAEIAAIDGVQSVEARISGHAILDIADWPRTAVGRILSFPGADATVLNVPLLVSGRFPDPQAHDEVVVNVPFAKAHGLVQGDRLAANLRGQKRTFRIVGTALSPEFVYTLGPGALMPDNRAFGIIWMPKEVTAAAYDMTGAFNDLSLTLTRGAAVAEVIDRLDHLLEPYGGLGAHDRSTHPSDAFLDAEINQLKGMARVLPPIFFGISAFLVGMVMSRIVALERSEIGLLKAMGYASSEVCLHYLMLSGLIAVVGVLAGWVAGGYLARMMAFQYAQFFDFPYVLFRVSPWVYAAAGLAGLLTTTLGAAHAALRAARLAPAIAMQPPPPPRFSRNLFDRVLATLRLSQSTRMILRSLLRWPLRSTLTALGMGCAVASIIASSFLNGALDTIVDLAFFQMNRQDAVLIFNDDLPENVLQEVRLLPGVLVAEGQQVHPAILRHGHLEKRVAIEARRPDSDLARVLDKHGRVVAPEPGGVLLSERLARALAASPGDMIEVDFLSGRRETHRLRVADVIEQYFGLGAYMELADVNNLNRQGPRLGSVNVGLDSAEIDALHAAAKTLPALAGIVEMTENRQLFRNTIEQNVVIMNSIYLVIAVLITVGVSYNAARIQLSERARELASLRILGFDRAEVSYILMGEIMLLALIAQPLGWAIGVLIAQAMTSTFTSDLYAIPLVLEPATFARGSLVVLCTAFAATMIVRRRIDKLDLVAVMKTRE